MNRQQIEEMTADGGAESPTVPTCCLRGVSVSRLSQNASCSISQDATMVVQVNDAEYRALAQRAHRSGCTVESLVARSIHNLLREE